MYNVHQISKISMLTLQLKQLSMFTATHQRDNYKIQLST